MFDWFFTQLGFSVVLMVVLVAVLMGAAGYATLLERKVAAWVQDRIGPHRAGPWGLLQPLADGLKLFFKEDFIPGGADKAIFVIAPMMAIGVALMGAAIIPWGGVYHPEGVAEPINVQVASLDIGLLFLLAVGAMGAYGVVLGGWSSNNKYSFFGGLRAAAQMLSYEVPMALAILVVVLTVGELRLESILAAQTETWWWIIPKWNVFFHPIAFLVLFTTALAETNRAPFDLAECEQELVLGFHTEYNSMKFGLYFLGEYSHMIVGSAFMVVLFFGGWDPLVFDLGAVQTSFWLILVQIGVLLVKIAIFIFVFMWIRWTLPRFRFDQLMRLAWKGFVPLMLLMLVATCGLLYYGLQQTIWALVGDVAVLVVFGLGLVLVRGKVTGRQLHMPEVPQASQSEVTAAAT